MYDEEKGRERDFILTIGPLNEHITNRQGKELAQTLPDFIDLVCKHRDWQCSDPRDKVYALLLLASPYLRIKPDYTLSAAELFIKMCTALSALALGNQEVVALGRVLELTVSQFMRFCARCFVRRPELRDLE